jgi:hypothetical protein
VRLKKSAKEWLDMFMDLHNLKTREEAVYKLIEIHKAWNEKLTYDEITKTFFPKDYKK